MRRTRVLPVSALSVLCAALALAACSGSSTRSAAPALDGITLSAGAIRPVFDPSVTSYSASIPAGTLNVTVTPVFSNDVSVTVSQDGGSASAVTSGAASAPLAVPARGTQSVVTLVATRGQASTTYTVQLVQADDNDATLSGLSLSAGTLNPAFSSAVTRYNVTIPAGTASFKITPTATQADVKSISVSQDAGTAATLTSGQQSAALKIPAAGATSTVVVTVTAQDGYDSVQYTLNLTLSGNTDATLASLVSTAGTLSPAFASQSTDYTLAVPVGTPSFKLTPTANNSAVRAILVSQDGGAAATVASGSSSPVLAVPAIPGTSSVAVKVIAQDGVSTVTYKITVKQDASPDAALSNLTVSAGALTPAFASTTTAYTDSVPYGTASVTLVPTAHALAIHDIKVSQDGGAPVTVTNGTGSSAFAVPAVGTNSTLTIVVTAQDAVTTKTYTVTLSQQAGTNAALSALSLSSGALSPAFDPATVAYTSTIPHGVATVTVTATPADVHAHSVTITQDGNAVSGGVVQVPAVGTPSTINVVVVSPDQSVTTTYTIIIGQAASSVSTLSALAVSSGTLTPAFSSGVTSYTVTVASDAGAFVVTPTASDNTETLQIAQDGGTPVTIASGTASSSFTIPNAGQQTVLAVVATAQDGGKTTYSITVSRAYATDATLSALSLSGAALSPSFASGTITYTGVAPYGTTQAVLSATANSPKAQSVVVTQDGNAVTNGILAVPPVGTSSTVTVVVTAEDGTTQQTYTVLFTQHAADVDANLASLTASIGAISPTFAAQTTSYALSVPYGSTSFTITPTAESTFAQSIMVTQDSGAPQTVASGSASQALTVPDFGTSSTIFVDVTAQSGATVEYKLVVTMAGQNDSSLKALTDSAAGLTSFDPATTDYSYSIAYQAGAYSITATTNDPFATLKVNGADATSGSPVTIALTPGATTDVAIAVTSSDTTSTTTYTLHITEAPVPTSIIGVSANSAAVTSGGAAVDFGSATLAGNTVVTFTIANSGNTAMTISSVNVTSGSADFGIQGTPSATVAANDATALTVRFAPSASGTRTGSITIANSSDNQPSFVVNLTGYAYPPATGVTVSGGGSTVNVGATTQLTATVAPSSASQSVTWSSGNTTVATVDGNGLVTANNFGQAVITATANDGSGSAGSVTVSVSGANNYVWFVKQTNGTTTASMSNGTFNVSSAYGTSGNAFKYVSGVGYYGTNANGFLTVPTPISGDFTATATIVLTQANKSSTSCGIGIGMTTGFLATDRYGYYVMTTGGGASAAQLRYVSAANTVNASGSAATSFTIGASGTALNVVFSRAGSQVSWGYGSTTASTAATAFSAGDSFGTGAVYPAISFNNVAATVTKFVVKDGAGNVVYDSSTGSMVTYIPPSISLSASSSTVLVGGSSTVTATAVAGGGGAATVSASSSNNNVATATVSGNTVTINGVAVGSATITVKNDSDSNPATNSKTIAVTVETFNATDGYGTFAGKTFPAQGETQAYADGELGITFDSVPTLNSGGSIDIYAKADGSLVDRIFFAGESQTVNGVTMAVGAQLARVSGNTVYFTPHFGKLQYGAQYYVGISTTAITGTFNSQTFTGFSNLNTVASWSFTTRAAPVLGATVNVSNAWTTTADFHSVGGALMYLAANPESGATAVTVNVAAGTYVELVNYRAVTANPALTITVSGPTATGRGSDTIIQYANGGGFNAQPGRATFYFAGANLVLQNVTLKSTGDRTTYQQAETLYFDSRAGYTVAVNNSSFYSHQDTIQTSGRAWFYNSYIEGNVDFIWGTSDAAVFESCDLHVVTDPGFPSANYAIFVARTGTTGAATIGKGYVLLNSRVSIDDGMNVAYARDAGTGSFYDQVALVGNTFSRTGTTGALVANLWNTSTAPLSLGDASYVGWKAQNNTGLGADTATPATGTSGVVAGLSSNEFDTRSHILNRVVTVTSGTPTGFTDASTIWDTSALATAWGAP